MKKTTYAVAIGLLMVLSYAAGWRHTARHATASTNARHVLYWVDPMHPDYKSDRPGIAPDCGMTLEPVYAEPATSASAAGAPLPAGAVGIDVEKQQLFGIRVAPVEKSSGTRKIRILGRVAADETRVYRVNVGVDGFVKETHEDAVGNYVKKDQRLAVIYAPEFLTVAGGYLSASERTQNTALKEGAAATQGFAGVQNWADRLRNLGMSDVQIKELNQTRKIPEDIYVVSPVDGFIVARNIAPGERFEKHSNFYRIVDLSRVWILADIFGSEAQSFHPGSMARVSLPDQGKAFSARVSNVLPQVDPSTRTLKLRLEADNPSFSLRPDMFVDVELAAPVPAGLTIPLDALIDSGREQRVFVERTSGVFEPREVQTGWRSGDRVQIVHGLAEGERVVSEGTFLVDSERRLKTTAQTSRNEQPHGDHAAKRNMERELAARGGKVKDPACGMLIDAAKAAAEENTLTRDGTTYYFCSQNCKHKFGQQPEHYLALNPPERRP